MFTFGRGCKDTARMKCVGFLLWNCPQWVAQNTKKQMPEQLTLIKKIKRSGETLRLRVAQGVWGEPQEQQAALWRLWSPAHWIFLCFVSCCAVSGFSLCHFTMTLAWTPYWDNWSLWLSLCCKRVDFQSLESLWLERRASGRDDCRHVQGGRCWLLASPFLCQSGILSF